MAGDSMEWIGLIVVAAGAYFLGRGSRSTKTKGSAAVTRSGLSSASDRDLMLATFRRELANYLVRFDPDRFLRLYHKARSVEAEIEKASNKEREAHFLLITKRYPLYEDFDFLGTREHVLYADAFDRHSIDEIEEHFLNLVKFHALQRADDKDWEFRGPATSDRDLDHLEKYIPKIKDTRFLQKLQAALREFLAQRTATNFELPRGQVVYETSTLVVFRVPHIVESRYGFHFKETNEFGLYSVYYFDDGGRSSERFYRSDATFEAEQHLDHLRIDESI
ncbi:hypothetical protein V1286_007601 [Bradyrhizobium algeriense]|uniref:Uncharacterized protein n=1 Tax=Bradyrhizobium algeriense TaxID=634784 RepID=A0ABU8BND9_9BRAD